MSQRIFMTLVALDIFIFAIVSMGSGRRGETLNLAKRMKFALCGYVGYMRLFCRHKGSKVFTDAVDNNFRLPTPVVSSGSAEHPMGTFSVSFAYVLPIFAVGRFSKVAYSVVVLVAINVVNLAKWVFAVHPKPSEPVSLMNVPIRKPNPNVTMNIRVPSGATKQSQVARVAVHASENSSLDVIRERFKQDFGVNIVDSHAVVPYKQWGGQRPRCVSSTSGLRYFTPQLMGCTV